MQCQKRRSLESLYIYIYTHIWGPPGLRVPPGFWVPPVFCVMDRCFDLSGLDCGCVVFARSHYVFFHIFCFIKLIPVCNMFQCSDHELDFC